MKGTLIKLSPGGPVTCSLNRDLKIPDRLHQSVASLPTALATNGFVGRS